MPILKPCRRRYCPAYADDSGWCPKHAQPLFGTDRQMSPEWRKLQPLILERDQWRCQLCGFPATHVDHIIPRSMGGTDHPSNLRSLCARCHHGETGRLFGQA